MPARFFIDDNTASFFHCVSFQHEFFREKSFNLTIEQSMKYVEFVFTHLSRMINVLVCSTFLPMREV